MNSWPAEILDASADRVPGHQIVRLSREFLAANPEVHLQTGHATQSHRARLALRLRVIRATRIHGDLRFYSRCLLNQVANAEQFLAVLAFDRWVANADGRQSIFFRAQLKDWLARPGSSAAQTGLRRADDRSRICL